MTADALWTFALNFYTRQSVSDACLRCQDEAGADVTILLLLLWYATQGFSFTDDAIIVADACIREWRHHIVSPLRSIRRWLPKGEADMLRNQIKDTELMAERIALTQLGTCVFDLEEVRMVPLEAARGSLFRYERFISHTLPLEAVEMLLAALDAWGTEF